MEDFALLKNILAVVGSVEMVKTFIKKVKVPGFVWALLTTALSVVSVLPFIPEWALDAALVLSVSTLFYDNILQRYKKKFGGEDA